MAQVRKDQVSGKPSENAPYGQVGEREVDPALTYQSQKRWSSVEKTFRAPHGKRIFQAYPQAAPKRDDYDEMFSSFTATRRFLSPAPPRAAGKGELAESKK